MFYKKHYTIGDREAMALISYSHYCGFSIVSLHKLNKKK